MNTTELSVAPRSVRRGASLFCRRLRAQPVALVATIIFLLFLLMAVFGPLIAPYDIQELNVPARLQAPSAAHPFGTDQLGRDILSRVLAGSREIFLIGGLGTLLAAVVGTAVGLFSGYYGGLLDEAVMRLFDVFLAIPPLLLALVLLVTAGSSNVNLVLAITVLYVPSIARIARSVVLELKNKEFVEAARVRGERDSYILFHEILPNSLAPLFVEVSIRFSYSIFLVASLGFLGLGVQPPSPDWGRQILEARDWFSSAPWMLLFPAGTIALLVIATSLMSDGIRHALYPERGRG